MTGLYLWMLWLQTWQRMIDPSAFPPMTPPTDLNEHRRRRKKT